jgi:hypothetical protein
MAKHNVSFQIPMRSLGKEDVVFRVMADDELLGTLKVSKGAVVWWPGNAKLGYKMGWARFDQMMREGHRGRHD